MAVRLQLLPLLPLLLCMWGCLRLASPLTDANWPPLSVQKVFNLTNLTDDEAYLVRESVRIAAARMESILKVLDLNPGRPLLLNRSRSHCASWSASGKEEKCMQLSEAYLTTGEQCSPSPDMTFNIPQNYLSELAVYNLSKIVFKEAGAGVSGVNFILFITTQLIPGCSNWQEKPVQSMSCSQQGKTKRPLAGVLNVCPQMITSELASRSGRLLQHALAGLVRILGFSGKLISNFQRLGVDAIGGDYWTTIPDTERATNQGGRTFIRTPAVLGFARRYFNCSLGIPLAAGSDFDAWDPAFLLQSALSASPILPGSLDEATLALLNDTGWYRANYSLADPIVWGRRAGCWFSQNCATPPDDPESSFCYDTASVATRPDISHRYEGPCTRIGGTNCSAILPLDSRSCPLSGNWRRLQLFDRSQGSNWTECLFVDCPSNDANLTYAVTRNSLRVFCNGSSLKEIVLNGSVHLLCAHYSLVCPRLSSVLDLLSGFHWPPIVVSTTSLPPVPDANLNFFASHNSPSNRFARSLSNGAINNSPETISISGVKTSTSINQSNSASTSTSTSPRAVYSTKAGSDESISTRTSTSTSPDVDTSWSSSSESSVAITTTSPRAGSITRPGLNTGASAKSSLASAATTSSTSADGMLSTSSSTAATTTAALSTTSATHTTLTKTTIVPGIPHIVVQLRDVRVLQTSSSSYQRTPIAKFSIRFATIDYFDLVKRELVPTFKASLQRSLVAAFQTAMQYISIGSVKPGSVIAIWENSDPQSDPETKLELVRIKVRTGSIIVQINGVNYTASSVERYTGQDESVTFPLMEVIIGSVVGALLLIGFILVIALVAMKHTINRPRMRVRPRSVDSSPTTSSQASRQCSAAPSGVMQLAVLGGAGPASSRQAVADVEATSSGGRVSGSSGPDRGVSAGSVGLQFSNSALYFDA